MRLVKSALAVCLVLAASLSPPPAAKAQTASAPGRDWSALKAVEQGSRLEVRLKTGKTVKGKLAGVNETALSLSVRDGATEVGRDDVRRVYVVKGRSAAKSTLIGAGVGAGAGALVGAATSDDDDFIFSRGQAAAVLAGLGAGVGAVVGFAVGKTGHKRVLVYEAGQP